MDQEALVEDLKKVYRAVSERHGPVHLLMLLAPDATSDSDWNVIVSARGFDPVDRASAIREMVELLAATFREENLHRVLRVTVLKTDNEFVRSMNSIFKTEESVLNLFSANVSHVEIPKAIVLQSKAA